MFQTNLLRNNKYQVKKVSYNQTIPYKGRYPYDKGLLRIEPNQDVKITITNFPHETEAEVTIEKYNDLGKQISTTNGIVSKVDLIKILGLDA